MIQPESSSCSTSASTSVSYPGIGHHCGIAFIRLRKPYEFYLEKYKDPDLLLTLMYLMLLRQRNRGLDAAGIATAFLPYVDRAEQEYLFKDKMISKDPVADLYASLIRRDNQGTCLADERRGNVMMGHVLYSTLLSQVDYRFVHPVEKADAWPTKRIVIAMNGNFANNKEQRDFLRSVGQAPTSVSDIHTLGESFGHFLNLSHFRLSEKGFAIEEISKRLDLVEVMRKVNCQLKGAFAIEGIVGNGDAFFARDPHGIRPLYFAFNDEFVVAASEISAIENSFTGSGIEIGDIKELPPGHIFIIKSDGKIISEAYTKDTDSRPCMFEPVYFNRPNNPGTYSIRKRLGELLAPRIWSTVDSEVKLVVSYVPNTSESAALGLYQELLEIQAREQRKAILALSQEGDLDGKTLESVLSNRVSFEQTLTKDGKIRTFITRESERNALVANAYDAIHDSAQDLKGKVLITVEDSVVKGTTLERNVIRTLAGAGATDILIVSSCPQIRYPCPYGIEMSKLHEFIAFRAALSLVQEQGKQAELKIIEELAQTQGQRMEDDPEFCPENLVARIYSLFSYDEISRKIAELVTPDLVNSKLRVRVLFPPVDQLIEGQGRGRAIDTACLDGTYPEIGGHRVLNRSLLNYFENRDEKAY
jgi:amidophosphoribosyltransferase